MNCREWGSRVLRIQYVLAALKNGGIFRQAGELTRDVGSDPSHNLNRTRSASRPPRAAALRGDCAQVVERVAEQVLTQVEEACPERRAVGRKADPGGVGEPLERTHEDG